MSTTVNGYQIQNALRELQHERDIAAQNFDTGLFVFEGDQGLTPDRAFTIHKNCEERIAKLQVLQARYNLATTVTVLGTTMTLHEAVKRVGGANRGEKMWKQASKKTVDSNSFYRSTVRNKDEVVARRTVDVVQCIEFAKQASKESSALREAIQTANSTAFTLTEEEALLFKQ